MQIYGNGASAIAPVQTRSSTYCSTLLQVEMILYSCSPKDVDAALPIQGKLKRGLTAEQWKIASDQAVSLGVGSSYALPAGKLINISPQCREAIAPMQ